MQPGVHPMKSMKSCTAWNGGGWSAGEYPLSAMVGEGVHAAIKRICVESRDWCEAERPTSGRASWVRPCLFPGSGSDNWVDLELSRPMAWDRVLKRWDRFERAEAKLRGIRMLLFRRASIAKNDV